MPKISRYTVPPMSLDRPDWRSTVETSKRPPQDWHLGTVLMIKDEYTFDGPGKLVLCLGEPVFLGQWWVPIIKADDPHREDPDFIKAVALREPRPEELLKRGSKRRTPRPHR